ALTAAPEQVSAGLAVEALGGVKPGMGTPGVRSGLNRDRSASHTVTSLRPDFAPSCGRSARWMRPARSSLEPGRNGVAARSNPIAALLSVVRPKTAGYGDGTEPSLWRRSRGARTGTISTRSLALAARTPRRLLPRGKDHAQRQVHGERN